MALDDKVSGYTFGRYVRATNIRYFSSLAGIIDIFDIS